jgi:hypothetical protein
VPFRWIDHIGELVLELAPASERRILEAGFHAMRELMSTTESRERIEVPVSLTGGDRARVVLDV